MRDSRHIGQLQPRIKVLDLRWSDNEYPINIPRSQIRRDFCHELVRSDPDGGRHPSADFAPQAVFYLESQKQGIVEIPANAVEIHKRFVNAVLLDLIGIIHEDTQKSRRDMAVLSGINGQQNYSRVNLPRVPYGSAEFDANALGLN